MSTMSRYQRSWKSRPAALLSACLALATVILWPSPTLPRRFQGVARAQPEAAVDPISSPDGSAVARWFVADLDPSRRPIQGSPFRVAVGGDDTVYLADASTVLRLSAGGAVLSRLGTDFTTRDLTGPGRFSRILDVAADASGNVYVVNDAGRTPVQILRPDNAVLAVWGPPTDERDPTAAVPQTGVGRIALGNDGSVLLAANDRVLRLGCPSTP